MSQTGQRPSPLAVGVDLGGTWLRLVALRDGHVVRGAHRAIPLSQLSKFLPTHSGGGRITSLVVASRGVWTPAERRAARRRLRGAAGRVDVISDVEAALLGALDAQPGVLVLAGTGSIVLGRAAGGRLARAGGLGPLLGDEGSAFWVGREWLRRTGATARARALAQHPDAVARVAALAPRVLARARRGDRGAREIVAAGQAQLAALAVDVIRRLRLRAPVRVSWSGGLLANAWYRAGVQRALARRVRCRWTPPAADAALAAARLAARRAPRGRR
jgi:N-acetylglucosamine kinase-like BadF-type ATPase